MSTATAKTDVPELFGHPAGLFTLFFAEMWERFSYYGMRALLVFYMIKGFLGMNDAEAYKIYGAYTALVYMTPYFGGMIADRILGRRRAVVLGGLLMAAGHLFMGFENKIVFFGALAFLIVGNGFFKPNISTMVGELYPQTSDKKDAGFTIFYMGINLGAAMSSILCGYVGQTFGWHYGFGLATGGMLVGVALFVAPTRITQLLLASTVIATSIVMPILHDTVIQLGVRIFMAVMLLAAGVIAVLALNRGGLPDWAGQPPSKEAVTRKIGGFLRADWTVYIGALVAVGLFTIIVQRNTLAGWILNITGVVAIGYIYGYYAFVKCTKVQRQRLFVILVLAVFHTCFWAFFEQAGTSLNNWTDRNIDRVLEDRKVAENEVGSTIQFRIPLKVDAAKEPELAKLPVLTQEQLGQKNGDPGMQDHLEKAIRAEEKRRNAKRIDADKVAAKDIDELVATVRKQEMLTMTGLDYLRASSSAEDATPDMKQFSWAVVAANVGMGIGSAEIPASEFQAANPIYILLFGLLFSALWTFLGKRGRDPSTPVKFALALAQLGLAFGVFWYGSQTADARGMAPMSYLLLGYLLLTTGELCLSPVGLSMVTKLSPKAIVSTVMGFWFISITYANYVAAVIAGFTGVSHGDAKIQTIPPPQETSVVYGEVFYILAAISFGAAVLCFFLKWPLNKWMHTEVTDSDDGGDPGGEAAEAA